MTTTLPSLATSLYKHINNACSAGFTKISRDLFLYVRKNAVGVDMHINTILKNALHKPDMRIYTVVKLGYIVLFL